MATGPSLSKDQVEYVRPFHAAGLVKVFGCNDTFKICDYLDVFYACDPHWWQANLDGLKHPCPEKWTQDRDTAKTHHLKWVEGTNGKGICTAKNLIFFGSNSGFQLLNLAWHFGARRFILLGYNMDVPKGMQQHFFGPHPEKLNRSNNYRSFVQAYRDIDKKTRESIINCTFPTALDCFAQKKLEEALPRSLLDAR